MPEIQALLGFMVQGRASDLFVAEGRPPAYRVDGTIVATAHNANTRSEIDGFLTKVLPAGLRDTFEKSGDLDLAVSLPDLGRFRLNVHTQRGVLGLVIRRIPSGQHTFEKLGLPSSLRALADERRGLLLVVGATGSGKSTTMAAMVHHINSSSARHIVTLEDPIEFIHDDLMSIVTQREIGVDTQDYHTALRHVVRESPDVIVIGELRDLQSMTVALSAALTGHLVIASLHTADSVQAIARILSWYADSGRHQLCVDLAGCLIGVVAQRLLPRNDGKGRVAAVELLPTTPAVKRLLREMRLEELPDILQAGEGVRSFQRAMLQLLETTAISLETGMAFSSNPEEFRLAAQGFERGVTALAAEHGDLPSVGSVDLKTLLHLAIKNGASDIHINVGSPPILRINGELRPLKTEKIGTGDARRLLFGLLNHTQRETFELERELDFAITLTGKHRCRVNAHYQRGTIAMAIRLIPMQIPDIRSLGLPQAIVDLASRQQGLVLVTGPTGSGKSTTLASLIHLVNSSRNCHIITVEDPIEFVHQNNSATIEQREIGADTKSFAAALKYILRQDPDVILVGEMRDVETIAAALTAAETGHLVFATLHTNDAPQTIDRIVDVFPPFQQSQIRVALSSCLTAVISQRLLARADGRGRVPAFEVMTATTAVRAIIREGKTFQLMSIIETGFRDGMVTLERSMGEHIRAGTVAFDEGLRFARSQNSLRAEVDKP